MSEGGGRSVLFFIFFVGLLSLAAIAIAVVSFVRVEDLRKEDEDGHSGLCARSRNVERQDGLTKTWYIHMGDDFGAFEFVDDDGHYRGFGRDLITAVCDEAGIDCILIGDEYSNCWLYNYGGMGLMSNWYVACSSWLHTVERAQVFDFTQPFAKGPTSNFFVKKGTTGFDPNDITGKKIGFKTSWASNPVCLSRQKGITGRNLAPENIVYFDDTTTGINLLQTDQVDAVYILYTDFGAHAANGHVDLVPNSDFQCQLAGISMMVRKGSDFINQFNEGLKKLRTSGQFGEMCEKAKTDYASHGTLDCT